MTGIDARLRHQPETPMKPELHAFFLDPDSLSDPRHAGFSEAYRNAWEEAGQQLELIAYTEDFQDLLADIPESVFYAHEPYEDEYLSRLTEFEQALKAIDSRRRQVGQLHARITECLSEARQLRADPEMAPHLDRVLPGLDELANAAATPARGAASRLASRPATELDRRNDGRNAARAWIELAERQPDATWVYGYISDPDEVSPEARNAIIGTFTANCEEAFCSAAPPEFSDLERIMRRSLEQHRRTMDDTPERTWETIKEVYGSIYEAAGSNIDGIAYQEGFAFLHDLARKTFDAGHYPDRNEAKLQALIVTLDTQNDRFHETANLPRAVHTACLQLDRLEEEARNLYHQPFRRTESYFEWLPRRDEIFARLHRLHADPVLKNHLHYVPDIERQIDRIADPSLSTAFDPVLADQRRRFDFSPEMEEVAAIYGRAHEDVHDADLIPYATAHFDDLETAIETAIGASTGNPRRLGALYTLQAQLSISTSRQEDARAAIDDLEQVSTQLTSLQAWASSNRQPIHRAPEFAAWRDRADEVHDRCQRMRTDYHLSVHFQRTGVSDDSVAMTLALLRDSRFQKPPSPEQIAAQRQARAQTRADSREESASMSA